MHKLTTIFIAIFICFTAFTQNRMRPVEELINTTEPGWLLVQQWIDSAKNKVEVLPHDSLKAKDALYKTQVTTRSPMGAIIYSTGGLLIDNGWIRVLGSGSNRLNRSLPDWNKGKSFTEWGKYPSFLLVADDAAGGFFAINGGQFGTNTGNVYYLAPDNLEWEPLDLNYSDFLNFCFNGDLAGFYENLRWKSWKEDVATLDGDKAYSFFPYLWTKEGKDINKIAKKVITVAEIYSLHMNSREQLGLD